MEVEVRGLPVHYESIGEGRPMLILHGLPGDHRFGLERYEPALGDRRGWRRIYPDMPGMGRTPGAPWIARPEDYVELLLAFMDAVAPGERFALIGVSWGGYVALGMTRAAPSRLAGLMLTAPLVRGDGSGELPPRFVLHRAPGIEALVEPDEAAWLQLAVVQTPRTLDAFRRAVKPGLQAADLPYLRSIERRFAAGTVEDRLPAPLDAPALVLLGRHDVAVGYAAAWPLLADLPRGTLAVLDGAGHGIEEEQPTLVRHLVHEWLDRVEAWLADPATG